MPDPVIVRAPVYRIPDTFLGTVVLPNDKIGLGYELNEFPTDPRQQTQRLINYSIILARFGYDKPSFNAFEGENQNYILFSGANKDAIYLLPYLKAGKMIVVIHYPDRIVSAFPDEMDANEAYAALVAKLDDENTRDQAANDLARIWKTSGMEKAITDKIKEDNMGDLLPVLIRNDFFTNFDDFGKVTNTGGSVEDIGRVIGGIITSGETVEAQLAAAKKAMAVLPAVDERYLSCASLAWASNSDMPTIDVTGQLPSIAAVDTNDETVMNDDVKTAHKYVVVCEFSSSGQYRLVPLLSLFLPADEIAGSIEEADRIIVCHNEYEPSAGKWTGGRPNDSVTYISLYDAADGTKITSIGIATHIQGFISHGNVPHDWAEMAENILAYFENR